jgi:hypothetical protein
VLVVEQGAVALLNDDPGGRQRGKLGKRVVQRSVDQRFGEVLGGLALDPVLYLRNGLISLAPQQPDLGYEQLDVRLEHPGADLSPGCDGPRRGASTPAFVSM